MMQRLRWTAPPGGSTVQGMKRRLLFAAGAATASALMWSTGARAFAAPGPVDLETFAGAVAEARQHLEASRLNDLAAAMPGLLDMAQATMDAASGADRSAAAGLTSRLLTVAGHVAYRTSDELAAGNLAAEARRLAEEATDAVATAEAERVAAVVVRRSGGPAATGLMVAAADRLEHATGLIAPAAVSAWAETLSSAAYTAAGFGALDDADELLRTAQARLEAAENSAGFTVNDVGVFAMSAAMNADVYDLVLERAERVDPDLLATGHQRAHFHKDLAIATAVCGEHNRAVREMERIQVLSPDFLAYRPWARTLARDLADTTPGAQSMVVQRLAR